MKLVRNEKRKLECTTGIRFLHDNITKTYKHGSEHTIDEIDSELKDISNNLGIGDKIEKMKKREAFISLKDHKENFENNPKCRLINPAKSESGKLSKIILDEINSNLRQKLNLNQWRNTKQVIEWFGNIKTKKDIVLFHLTSLIFTHPFRKNFWTKHYLGLLI